MKHHEEEDIVLVATNNVEPILVCHYSSHCCNQAHCKNL